MKLSVRRRPSLALIAAAGSLGLLVGALSFQYIGGLAPCVLCISQRWPHVAAILFGVLSLKIKSPVVSLLGAASAATSAGYGIYHTGVERGFWEGTQACSGNLDLSHLSAVDAYDAILNATVAKCDEVAWQMAGLSMASWNAVLSSLLAALWVWSAVKTGRGG
jgi:disulfide bond formation protein DsbB